MKIVFEFFGKKPQVSFSMHPYASKIDRAPEWNGARVEGLIVDTKAPLKPEGSDVLYLEGDLASIRFILAEVTEQLDSLEEIFQEEKRIEAARSRQCSVCKRWFDTKHNDDGHGDGWGLSCMGDGTAKIGGAYVVIQGQPETPIHTSALVKGARFLLSDTHWPKEFENHVFEALSDGNKHGVLVKRPPSAVR